MMFIIYHNECSPSKLLCYGLFTDVTNPHSIFTKTWVQVYDLNFNVNSNVRVLRQNV